jgi:hypothetical protein
MKGTGKQLYEGMDAVQKWYRTSTCWTKTGPYLYEICTCWDGDVRGGGGREKVKRFNTEDTEERRRKGGGKSDKDGVES